MEEDTFEVVREEFCVNNDLSAKWELFAENVVKENREEIEEKIAIFRRKLETEDEYAHMRNNEYFKDRPFFVRYLRGANWDPRVALDLLKASYNQVQSYYPYMSVGTPSQLGEVWRHRLLFIPQFRDSHGRRVFIMRLGKWNANVVPIMEFFTATYTLFELLAIEEKTQIAGLTVIVDVKGFSISHLRWLNVDMLKCLGSFLTGAFPIWFRKIHIIHNYKIFNYLFSFNQMFLGERVRGNFILHESNLNSLHKYVPPSILPEDLGGDLVEDNEQSFIDAAIRHDEYFRLQILNAGKLLETSKTNSS